MFFFFKQMTAYEMRISDWSSDVCSSDLALLQVRQESRVPVSAVLGRESGQPRCCRAAADHRRADSGPALRAVSVRLAHPSSHLQTLRRTDGARTRGERKCAV